MAGPKPLFVLEKLFSDPTPGGRINQRIGQRFFFLARELTDLSEQEVNQFFGILLYLCRKLASVWVHLERYRAVEKELVGKLRNATPPVNPQVLELEYSQELFQEFDEFLVQLKSALDHLVKAPVPIFGSKVWTLRTFGDKGRDVTNALEKNIPRKYRDMVAGIKKMLFQQHGPWLNDVIRARDKVNHFIEGGLRFEHFGVHKLPDGTIQVPMWSPDQTLLEGMAAIWENLFRFTEDFLAMFLFFRHKPGLTLFHGPEPTDPTKSPWILSTEAVMEATVKQPGWTQVNADA